MFRRLSLPAKATLLLSLVVFGVVLALTYFMAQSSKSVIEDDYRKRSITAADRLASKLGEHPELPSKNDMEDLLFGASEKKPEHHRYLRVSSSWKRGDAAATSSSDDNIPVTSDIRSVIEMESGSTGWGMTANRVMSISLFPFTMYRIHPRPRSRWIAS